MKYPKYYLCIQTKNKLQKIFLSENVCDIYFEEHNCVEEKEDANEEETPFVTTHQLYKHDMKKLKRFFAKYKNSL